MRKFLLLAVALMTASMVNSQVVKGTIGNGYYTISDGTTIPRYGLDFDNDSVIEFVVSAYFDMETYATYEGAHLEYRLDLFNNVITVSDDDYTSIKLLDEGSKVSAACSFLGEGEAMFSDFSAISATASYAGFMMTYGTSVHYGYARFHLSSDTVLWDAIYYNASPTQAITVGEVSEPTSLEQPVSQGFVAAAVDGLRINVVQENDDTVKVYDMGGRMVGTAQGENIFIPVPAPGVYVIRNSHASAKLVVGE